MAAGNKIKTLLTASSMTMSELAEKMGVSQPNLSQRIKRDNFNENDLRKIAEIFDVELEIHFVFKDGRRI
ncbi:transcriptional regulator [[Bacillus] sp. KCTC 13219]|nr:transcriptional regulator [[Bacillus] sp. KCTC 13219]